MYLAFKFFISAACVVAISELAKRSLWLAALVAALPLTSLLAFAWMNYEGVSVQSIIQLSRDIFWLVLPLLALFQLFPMLLGSRLAFFDQLCQPHVQSRRYFMA